MFRSIRLRLIGSVAGVLALVLLAAGGIVYVLLTRQLDAAVETQLRAKLPDAPGTAVIVKGASSLPPTLSFTGPPGVAISAGIASPPALAGEPDIQAGNVALVSAADPQGLDGVFVSQWWQGEVSTIMGIVPAGLPDLDAIRSARLGHDDERTVTIEDRRYRLLTRVLPNPLAGSTMVFQAGISMATRDREERSAVLALAGGGLLGVVLVAGGGLFLTNRALQPLQLAFERQRRFVADASHELRTPLALVRLEAEALADRLDAAAESRPLLSQVNRVSRLVDHLLTLARLDQGVVPVQREPVHLGSLLDTAAAAARRLAGKGVAVVVTAPPDAWATGDPDHLHQILLILIDNACRVTPAGGRIDLSGAVDGQTATITVADTGPGIPPEHLGRIFERFYRIDQARSHAQGGTGLGLAIAHELAQAQGGRISLDSPPGGGVIASLRLPSAVPPISADDE